MRRSCRTSPFLLLGEGHGNAGMRAFVQRPRERDVAGIIQACWAVLWHGVGRWVTRWLTWCATPPWPGSGRRWGRRSQRQRPERSKGSGIESILGKSRHDDWQEQLKKELYLPNKGLVVMYSSLAELSVKLVAGIHWRVGKSLSALRLCDL